MPIKLNHYVTDKTEFSDLAAVREEILAAAKAAAEAGRHDALTVALDGGYYYLTEPFVLSKAENPELASLDITIRAKHPRAATISSWGRVLGRDFTRVAGSKTKWVYQFPKNEDGSYPLFHELFVNGGLAKRTESARWKNPVPLTPEERRGEVKREGLYVPYEIAEALAAGEMGATEIMMYIEWEFAILHVASVDLTNTRDFKGVKHALVKLKDDEMDYLCEKCISILNIGERVCFFQNAPAFLTDEPYTYAYDYHNGVIYLSLPDDAVPSGFAVEYPLLENLFYIEGLENVTFEDLCFTGVTTKNVCKGPYIAGQANNARGGKVRHAAILAEGTRGLTVRRCSITGVGGNGIFSFNNSWGLTVESCTFKNVGMSGVCVGNSSYRHAEPIHRNFATRIHNNYFAHIGYDFPGSPCICIGMVDGLTITKNTIDGCAYSGMSVGWGWSTVGFELGEMFNVRDAEISHNYIKNFMDCLRDGGAIYVLGGNVNPTNARRFNRMHDNFAILDECGKGEKYGYYCDGSSSNWDVCHSVMVNCARPLFSQYTVASAFTHHNHLHDIYFTVTPNMLSYAPSHAPYRDSLLYDLHSVKGDLDALIAEYPIVEEIRAAAGCTIAH